MDDQETGYDYCRYKRLLAEAVDETKRLELIEIMIKENARERLEAQQISDRVAITAVTVARVLGSSERTANPARVPDWRAGGPDAARPGRAVACCPRKPPLLCRAGLGAGNLPRVHLPRCQPAPWRAKPRK
jgi:hypothetical protein